MGCADYRLNRNGDSDSDGNDLLYGVLIKKASWSYSKALWLYYLFWLLGRRDATTVSSVRLVVTKSPHVLQQVGAKFRRLLGS